MTRLHNPARLATRRWRISLAFMVLATIALAIGFVGLYDQQQSLNATNDRICAALAFLTQPVSANGETDAAALARIKAANENRAQAREKLYETLACDR